MKADKLLNYIKEKANVLVISVIVIIGILLVSKVYLEDRIPDHTTYLGHAGEEQFIYNLTDDDVIIQEFSSPHDFDYATLHFSNHDQRIEGKTFIKVEKVYDNSLVTYLELDNPSITYDEYIKLDFGGGGVKDELYRITISFDGMGEQGLGIMGYEYPGSFLPPCNLSLLYAVAVGTHSTTYKFQLFAKIMVFYLCMVVLWGIYVFGRENWKSEQRFLAIAIPMGVFFLMFPAINPVYDGGHHLYTTYHYSNYMFKGTHDNTDTDMLSMKNDEVELINYGYSEKINFHADNTLMNQIYQYGKHFRFYNMNTEWMEFHSDGTVYDASIMGYFPAAVAITVCRILHLSVYIELLFAKVLTALFYLCISYLAIKITPVRKNVFAFVCLLPMALSSAIGITYDSIVVSACILLISIYVKSYYSFLGWKDLLIIGISCYSLGENKGGVYLLLPLIFFSMPKRIGEQQTKRWRVWSVGLLCGFLGILPTIINVYLKHIGAAFQTDTSMASGKYIDVASLGLNYNTISEIINYRLQNGTLLSIKDVVDNPFTSLKMILLTLFDQADVMFGQLIGNRMAWSGEETSWLIIFGIAVLVLMAAIQQEKNEDIRLFNPLTKAWICTLFVAQTLVFYIIMMVTETGEYDKLINGVQGRYFISWIPIMMMLLSNMKIQVEKDIIRIEYFIYSMLYVCFGMSYLVLFSPN